LRITNPRREAIYQKLKEQYPDKNIVFDFNWTYADQSELTKVLQRSRIVLNIPYHEHTISKRTACHKALACGCRSRQPLFRRQDHDKFMNHMSISTHDIV
jgi:hypothetical protein